MDPLERWIEDHIRRGRFRRLKISLFYLSLMLLLGLGVVIVWVIVQLV